MFVRRLLAAITRCYSKVVFWTVKVCEAGPPSLSSLQV